MVKTVREITGPPPFGNHPGRRTPNPIVTMMSGPTHSIFPKKKKGKQDKTLIEVHPVLTEERADILLLMLEAKRDRMKKKKQRTLELPVELTKTGVFRDVSRPLLERWETVKELTRWLHDIRKEDHAKKVRAIISSVKVICN
jgi:hypothetical protein